MISLSHKKFLFGKSFDDVIACDLWFRPPPIKNSGHAYKLEIARKTFLKNFFFFWRTLAPVSSVLGLGLEHSCPYPREGLSSERLSLASDFFCVLGLGLEPCVLDSTSVKTAVTQLSHFRKSFAQEKTQN